MAHLYTCQQWGGRSAYMNADGSVCRHSVRLARHVANCGPGRDAELQGISGLLPQARAAGAALGDGGAAERLRAGLAVAAAAATEHAAGPGARANAGTGEVLRANFLLLCGSVAAADGHLLAEEELHFMAAFQVIPWPRHQ